MAATQLWLAPLFGISQGCAVALLYAVRHPERVSRLVLWNVSARTLSAPDYPAGYPLEVMEAGIRHMEQVWGTPEAIRLTDPSKADPGTIRKLFAKSIGENTVHGSDSQENAAIEIAQFFTDADIVG